MQLLLFRLALVLAVTIVTVVVGQRFLWEEEADPEAVSTKQVRVASVDLAAGTFLDGVEAPFRPWPEDEIERGWTAAGVSPDRDIIGAVVIRPIHAGTPIDRADLLMPGQDGFLAAALDPGMRAVSVAVNAVSGNAGHVFPGDRVDLILTQRLDGFNGRADDWVSETILESVRVIAVDQDLLEDLAARDEPSRVPRTFTLEVSPGDAERIAVAGELGRLSFSLRPLLTETRPDGTDAERGGTYGADVSSVRRQLGPEIELAAPPVALKPATEVRVLRGRDAAVVTTTVE